MLFLALSHVLCLSLLLVLRLSSLMDPTIAYMVLIHERTALSLDALVTAHVLIMVHIQFESRRLDGPRFLRRGSRPTRPSGEMQSMVKISSGHMVKCWIPKIYLTNPSTEPSTVSHLV
jgi:hypothetical protein